MNDPDDEVKELIEHANNFEAFRQAYADYWLEQFMRETDCAMMCLAEGRSAEL